MFEKEAKAYAERTKQKKELEVLNKVQDWGIESLDPDERRLLAGIQDREKARKQGFRKGAEFGYNKASEWHYVKNGDLPSDRHGHVVINQDWDKVTIRNGRFECLDGSKANVIAWREIIYPDVK